MAQTQRSLECHKLNTRLQWALRCDLKPICTISSTPVNPSYTATEHSSENKSMWHVHMCSAHCAAKRIDMCIKTTEALEARFIPQQLYSILMSAGNMLIDKLGTNPNAANNLKTCVSGKIQGEKWTCLKFAIKYAKSRLQ
eukprot:1142289-Pelagomonas_calceolata.AAC.4